eukprot:g15129.t1
MAKWDDRVARRLYRTLAFVALITSTPAVVCFLTSTTRPSLDVRWRHRESAARSTATGAARCGRLPCPLHSLLSSTTLSPSSSGGAPPWLTWRGFGCGASGISGSGASRASSTGDTSRGTRSRSSGSRNTCSITATTLTAGGGAAAGSGTREEEGGAAAAAPTAASFEGRVHGHSCSGTGTSDGSRRSDGNPPSVPAAAYEEGKGRGGSRTPGMLSRGVAVTGRFFASERRRNPSSRRRGDERGGGVVEERGAAAKLESEEAAREKEGLRVVPRHVAFVMDGNGRWAAERNKPRRAGHVEGARRAGEAVESCRQLGVEFVTLYVFSTENWNRPEGEVSFLMDLMEKTLQEQRDGLRRNGIRLTAIGELHRLPPQLRSLLLEIQQDSGGSKIDSVGAGAGTVTGIPNGPASIAIPAVVKAEQAKGAPRNGSGVGTGTSSARSNGGGCSGAPSSSPTAETTPATKMTLCLAISYGGRSELAEACRDLACEAAAGRLDPADIDEAALGRRLSTARLGLPDPDLVVRTSGESRLSNLLVWQSAYAELHVVGKAWPDFRRADLVEAFRDFGRRRRRYGKTPEQIQGAEIEA